MYKKTKPIGQWIVLACLGYMSVSFMIFEWNNPLANRMSFFRDFVSVMKWETLPQYQIR